MDQQYLRNMAKEVSKHLPDGHGFIILAFPFDGQGENRTTYISNGQRTDCVKALKEFLFRIGEEEDWMKHIN